MALWVSVAKNWIEPNSSSRLICLSWLEQNLSGLKFGCLSHHSPNVDLRVLGFLTTGTSSDLNYVSLDGCLNSLHDGTEIWVNRRGLRVPKIDSFWGIMMSGDIASSTMTGKRPGVPRAFTGRRALAQILMSWWCHWSGVRKGEPAWAELEPIQLNPT